MNTSRLFSLTHVPLLVACVSTNVDVPRDHPANPAAPVTQVALTPTLATTVSTTEQAAPEAHQHGGHDQHDGHDPHGSTSAPSASPAAPASAPAAARKQADNPAAEVWTCPMHPEVAKSGPGQCPICGMNLVKRAPGKAK
jgi:hypothetical protein